MSSSIEGERQVNKDEEDTVMAGKQTMHSIGK